MTKSSVTPYEKLKNNLSIKLEIFENLNFIKEEYVNASSLDKISKNKIL